MDTAPRDAAGCTAHCPALVKDALDLLAAKWAVPVLVAVDNHPGPARYADVQRAVGGITAKELAKQLRSLEAAGVLGRRVHPTVPPKVEYWVTEFGGTLIPVLESLADWGAKFGGVVRTNREIMTR